MEGRPRERQGRSRDYTRPSPLTAGPPRATRRGAVRPSDDDVHPGPRARRGAEAASGAGTGGRGEASVTATDDRQGRATPPPRGPPPETSPAERGPRWRRGTSGPAARGARAAVEPSSQPVPGAAGCIHFRPAPRTPPPPSPRYRPGAWRLTRSPRVTYAP